MTKANGSFENQSINDAPNPQFTDFKIKKKI